MKTLKEKEHRIGNIDEEIKFFYTEDVKEFIKRLKEELERGVKRNNIFPLDWCFDSIDKLSGFEE